MKFSRNLFFCFALSASILGAFADTPATNAAPATPVPAKKVAAKKTSAKANTNKTVAKTSEADKKTPASAATPTPAPAPAVLAQTPPPGKLTLDDYIKDLTEELKLSDTEKKQIEKAYVDDGVQLKNILNDGSLSPLQQTQQATDLRNARNTKIGALLNSWDRQRAFLAVEAKYRVALLELAADGKLVATPPAPTPADKKASS
jgi:hypothetical protein